MSNNGKYIIFKRLNIDYDNPDDDPRNESQNTCILNTSTELYTIIEQSNKYKFSQCSNYFSYEIIQT